jgi:nucleoid-associated protein YgaU
MARGTKIALAFLLVLFVGTGVYFTLTAPSPNPTGDLSSGGLTADGGLGAQSPTDAAFPETIVLGPGATGTPAIEVIAPPAGTEIDIFDQPAVDPALANQNPAALSTGPGVTNGGGGPNGPAPVFVEPAAPVAATSTYTVASGDTLGGIAKKTYGRESAWTAIRDANPGVNPNNLKVGTALKLPSADQLPASEQVAAATKSSRGASRGSSAPAKKGGSKSTGSTGRRYTVKNGDTLWKIAKAEYGTATKANVDRIREANSIGSDGSLKAGQSLTIPAK